MVSSEQTNTYFSSAEIAAGGGVPQGKDRETESAMQQLLGVVGSLFPYQDKQAEPKWIKNKEERPSEILARLIGSNRTRIGPEPNDEAKKGLESKIRTAVERSLPVQLLTVWGTSRDPQGTDNVAELADFSAMQMLHGATERIRSVHPPGATVRIFEEDATCAWLDNDDPGNSQKTKHVWEQMNNYWNTKGQLFHTMTNASGIGMPFEFVRESELLKRMGISQEQYEKECAGVKAGFAEYLTESGRIMRDHLRQHNFTSWEQAAETLKDGYPAFWQELSLRLAGLSSFQRIKRDGWIGTITPEMRAFYAKKHAKLDQTLEENPERATERMAHYFASTCRKAALGTLYFGLPYPQTAIKTPLTLVPNGRPQEFSQLVLLRSMPKETGKGASPECVAPWLGRTRFRKGILELRTDDGNTTGDIRVNLRFRNAPVRYGTTDIDYPLPTRIRLNDE